jgi:hypothetical protein
MARGAFVGCGKVAEDEPAALGAPFADVVRGRRGVSGSIVPNGGGSGSGGVVYSPTIQIDTDRAAVMADTAKAVKQGQNDLMALLKRYNTGLKM